MSSPDPAAPSSPPRATGESPKQSVLTRPWSAILRDAVAGWWKWRTQLGASLAFAAVFSIAPLLLIALAVAGYIYGEDAASGELRTQLTETLGVDAASMVNDLIKRSGKRGDNVWAAAAGVAVLLWAVFNLTSRLKGALNQMWKATDRRRGFWWHVRGQALAMLIVIASGCLMLASLVFSVWARAVAGPLAERLSGFGLGHLIDVAVSLAVHSLLLSVLLKYLPDANVPWRAAWIGALVAAILLYIGQSLFSIYLSNASIKPTYGAAASVFVLLIWANYSAQMFLLGAEVTRATSEAMTAAALR